jgi:hypothetical protein
MGLFDLAVDFAFQAYARERIQEGLATALSTMQQMCANEGQTAALNKILPEFTQAAQASPEDGWPGVSCDPYCDFIGEIVEEGNNIMEEAYDEAGSIIEEGFDY